MNTFNLIKTIGDLAVSAGVGNVVGNIVRSTTPKDISKFTKFTVTIGGAVLAGMVGDKATEYTDMKIEEVLKIIKKHDEETEEV